MDPQPRVLLVERDFASRATQELVIRELDVDLEVRSDLQGFEPGRHQVVIVNYDGLREADRESLYGWFGRESKTTTRLVLRSAGEAREHFGELFGRRILTNLLAHNGTVYDLADCRVTLEKLLDPGRLFGIERYYTAPITSTDRRVTSSAMKQEIVGLAEEFAAGISAHPRLANLYAMVAEELVLNAIFNAPIDPSGQRRHAHLSRKEKVELRSDEAIEVRFCCDGVRLGLSVRDPFGSLDPARVLEEFGRSYSGSAVRPTTQGGGAGLGLFMIFESLSHLVVNIAPSRATEVIGLIDLAATYREFIDRSKSFNLFVGPETDA